MPGYDKTGPRGDGAMTGGGRGACAIPVAGGLAARGGRRMGVGRVFGGIGRGWGFGLGSRRGRGYGLRFGMAQSRGLGLGAAFGTPTTSEVPSAMRFGTPPSPEQELALLREQAQGVRRQLETIEQRISKLRQNGNTD